VIKPQAMKEGVEGKALEYWHSTSESESECHYFPIKVVNKDSLKLKPL
jgi:hypothetical protein